MTEIVVKIDTWFLDAYVYSSYECVILEKYREVGGRNG